MRLILEQVKAGVYEYQIYLPENQKDEDPFYYLNNPEIITICQTCNANITETIKVNAWPDDYCVGCFAKLEKFPKKYRIISALDMVLFEADWTAQEEVLLIEGIETNYFDWEDIADYMETYKDPENIRDHYQQTYLSNQNYLPTHSSTQINRIVRLEESFQVPENPEQKSEQITSQAKNNQVKYSMGDVNNGCFLKRQQFEHEAFDYAETLITQLQINEDDTEQIFNSKIEAINMYLGLVEKRQQMKQFVIQRKIIDLAYNQKLYEERSQMERKIHGMCKPFRRFLSDPQFNFLIENAAKAIDIKARIAYLHKMNKKGLKTLEQVDKYEQKVEKKEYWDNKKLEESKINALTRKQAQKQARFIKLLCQFDEVGSEVSVSDRDFCDKNQLEYKILVLVRGRILLHWAHERNLNINKMPQFKVHKSILKKIVDYMKRNNDIPQLD